MIKKIQIIPHTADLKLCVYGKTLQELFKNALIGMFQCMEPKSHLCIIKQGNVQCSYLPIKRIIKIDACVVDFLLVDFLSEALCLSDIYNEAYFDVRMISFSDTSLECELLGIPVEGFFGVEIKAITYHELALVKIDNVWQTHIVFDI